MSGWRGILEWLGVFWPTLGVTRRACITLADAVVTVVTLADAVTTTITLADAPATVVTLADSKC